MRKRLFHVFVFMSIFVWGIPLTSECVDWGPLLRNIIHAVQQSSPEVQKVIGEGLSKAGELAVGVASATVDVSRSALKGSYDYIQEKKINWNGGNNGRIENSARNPTYPSSGFGAIQSGLSEYAVKRLLGDPKEVYQGRDFTSWIYPNGYVKFRNQVVFEYGQR